MPPGDDPVDTSADRGGGVAPPDEPGPVAGALGMAPPSGGDSLDSAPLEVPAPAPAATPPRTPVDCAATLPCRLVPPDGGVAATLTAADGEALDGSGPLRIDVVLEATSRDASVAVEPTSSLVAGGQVLEADALQLGAANAPGARDEASFALVAGVPINGHVTFGGDLVGNPTVLDRVTLHLTEAGATRAATFAAVPLGPEPGVPIDCANTLPCRWTSLDGTTTLALTNAAPARWNSATRLVVSFSLSTTRPLEVALSGPGRVLDGSGTTLEPYGIELGGVESRDGTVLVQSLAAGEAVAGRVVPRRAPADGETTLSRVEIPVVERRSPRAPRWRPVFANVPLRTPDPAR